MNSIIALSRAVRGSRSNWVAGFYSSSRQAQRDLDQLELDKTARLVAAGWPTQRARAYVRARFGWAMVTGGYTGQLWPSRLARLGTPDFAPTDTPF